MASRQGLGWHHVPMRLVAAVTARCPTGICQVKAFGCCLEAGLKCSNPRRAFSRLGCLLPRSRTRHPASWPFPPVRAWEGSWFGQDLVRIQFGSHRPPPGLGSRLGGRQRERARLWCHPAALTACEGPSGWLSLEAHFTDSRGTQAKQGRGSQQVTEEPRGRTGPGFLNSQAGTIPQHPAELSLWEGVSLTYLAHASWRLAEDWLP